LVWWQVGSTILAQAAGVPTLPWSGSGVAISFEECNGNIPPDLYAKVRPGRPVRACEEGPSQRR